MKLFKFLKKTSPAFVIGAGCILTVFSIGKELLGPKIQADELAQVVAKNTDQPISSELRKSLEIAILHQETGDFYVCAVLGVLIVVAALVWLTVKPSDS